MYRTNFIFFLSLTSLLQAQSPPPSKGARELPPLERPLEQTTIFAREATEAMRSRDWVKAAEKWEDLLKIQPESAAALSNLGSVEIKLGKNPQAIQHLEKAVTLRPKLAATWMTLGLLHSDMGNPMMAISCLSRAIHEDPADSRLHNALAVVLKQVGWTNGAEMELQKCIDLNPDYAEGHFNLALLYLEQKPPALESARRHYFFARDLGAPPDELVDKQFKEAGIVYTPNANRVSPKANVVEGNPDEESPPKKPAPAANSKSKSTAKSTSTSKSTPTAKSTSTPKSNTNSKSNKK